MAQERTCRSPCEMLASQRRRRILVSFRALLVLMPLLSPIPVGSQTETEEYLLKAVFLERFARFVEWPEERTAADQPFVIGVIGSRSAFLSTLVEAYQEQEIREREVVIRHLAGPEEITGCWILYVTDLNSDELEQVLEHTRGQPILTVADTAGYAERGIHINFFIQQEKLRFEINEQAVRDSGLEMSFLLLNVATIVGSPAVEEQ